MLIKWNSVGGEKMLFIEKVFEQFHDFWLTIMIDIFFIDIIKFYSYFLGLMMTYDKFSSFLIEKFIFAFLFQRTWNRNFMLKSFDHSFRNYDVIKILFEIIEVIIEYQISLLHHKMLQKSITSCEMCKNWIESLSKLATNKYEP